MMFDMSQIVEKISGLFENGDAAREVVSGRLSELVQNASIDLSVLENASVDQLGELLTQAGIDPSNLTDGQILETAQDLVQSGVLDQINLDQSIEFLKRQ